MENLRNAAKDFPQWLNVQETELEKNIMKGKSVLLLTINYINYSKLVLKKRNNFTTNFKEFYRWNKS